ncbi:MAG: tetratricopeptide repeat protein, partial [Nitrospinota bacterium]|nr:tetratricopeptide repeat protein [Nitrospinota bacterium]
MGPGESGVATADILEEHLDKKIRLFIFDKSTLSQSENFLRALKFNNVEVSPVPASYISAIQQLYLLLKKDDDLILVNPPLTVVNGKTKIKKDITEYFSELKRLVHQKSKSDSIELLSKCVPIFPEANMLQIREKLLLSLAEFGITGAFILKQQESLIGLSQAAQKEKKAELMAERFNEIRTYLIDHFSTNPDDAIKNIRLKMDEKELTRKKKESQKWMSQAEEYKKTKNYEEAINCYKKAIDAYPKDPAAYMESGKTYVRIQKYSRALERFKQASEISEDLPTPNQEIGNLRITQAREMIAKGANPENPQVKELLRDAIDN